MKPATRSSAAGGTPTLRDELLEALKDEAVIELLASSMLTKIGTMLDRKLLALGQQISAVTERASKLETALTETKATSNAMNEEIRKLNMRVEAMEAYSRRENLVISGLQIQSYTDATSSAANSASNLPVGDSNDAVTDAIVKLCSTKLGVSVGRQDISFAHRLGRASTSGRSPGLVIVRFSTRRARDLVYHARTKLKSSRENIYINEHLTERSSSLSKECRDLRKAHRIHSTWTYNGTTYVKVTESSSKIVIKDSSDLAQFH